MSKQSRRDWLFNVGYGFGGLALNGFMPGGGMFSVPTAQAAAAFVDLVHAVANSNEFVYRF